MYVSSKGTTLERLDREQVTQHPDEPHSISSSVPASYPQLFILFRNSNAHQKKPQKKNWAVVSYHKFFAAARGAAV